MAYLQGIGPEFNKRMPGWIGEGKTDCEEGRLVGQNAGTKIAVDCDLRKAEALFMPMRIGYWLVRLRRFSQGCEPQHGPAS